jgi:hypothetical protein
MFLVLNELAYKSMADFNQFYLLFKIEIANDVCMFNDAYVKIIKFSIFKFEYFQFNS